MENFEEHERTKKTLKIVGIILAACGLVCSIIGFVDFFAAFGGEGMPKLFFMLFIGLPLFAIGTVLLVFGYRRELMRYGKNEAMPVINEAGEQIKPFVKSVASAAKESGEKVVCAQCGAENDGDAEFCKSCGKPMKKVCPDCKKGNDGDASFCDGCGKKL